MARRRGGSTLDKISAFRRSRQPEERQETPEADPAQDPAPAPLVLTSGDPDPTTPVTTPVQPPASTGGGTVAIDPSTTPVATPTTGTISQPTPPGVATQATGPVAVSVSPSSTPPLALASIIIDNGGTTVVEGTDPPLTDTDLQVNNDSTLNILNGGEVRIEDPNESAPLVLIGVSSRGTVNLLGASGPEPATLLASGVVGEIALGTGTNGYGLVTVGDGGRILAGRLSLGLGDGSTGDLTIDGGATGGASVYVMGDYAESPAAGTEDVDTFVFVGNLGGGAQGFLTLVNEASLYVANASSDAASSANRDDASVVVGNQTNTFGRLTVDNSTLDIVNNEAPVGPDLEGFTGLRVSADGTGEAVIRNNAVVRIDGANAGIEIGRGSGSGLMTIESGSSVVVDSGNYGFAADAGGPDQGAFVQIGGGSESGITGRLLITNASLRVESNTNFQGDYQTGDLTVGRDGSYGAASGYGRLSVYDGSTVTADEVAVFGGGSSLVISNGSTVQALSKSGARYRGVTISDGATATVSGGTLTSGSAYDPVAENSSGRLRVGFSYGISTLNIDNGGQVNAFFAEVGRDESGNGNVRGILNITGEGSRFVSSSNYGNFDPAAGEDQSAAFLRAGRNGGEGRIYVRDGGEIELSNRDLPSGAANPLDDAFLQLGRGTGAFGYLFVGRDGSTAPGSYQSLVNIEITGPASDTTEPGTVRGAGFQLGRDGGIGSAVISEDGRLRVASEGAFVTVGQNSAIAPSSLNIENGGRLDLLSTGNYDAGAYLNLGFEAGSSGVMNISGSAGGNDSTVFLQSNNTTGIGAFVTIGRSGNGNLFIGEGGDLIIDGGPNEFTGLRLGAEAGSFGTISIDGAGSTLSVLSTNLGATATASATATIGRAGTGSLFLTNGASFELPTLQGAVFVGREAGSIGYVALDNDGAAVTFNAGGLLGIGTDYDFDNDVFQTTQGGDGRLSLVNGAAVTAGTTVIGASGEIEGSDGIINGDVDVQGGIIDVGQLTINGNLNAVAGSEINLDATGLLSVSAPPASFNVVGTATLSADAIELDTFSTELEEGRTATLISTTLGLAITDLTRDNLWIGDIGFVPDEAAVVVDPEDAQGLFVFNDGFDLIIETLDPGQPGVLDGGAIDFTEFTQTGLIIDLLNGTGTVDEIANDGAFGVGGGALLGVTDVTGTLAGDIISVLTTDNISVTGGRGDDDITTGEGDNTINPGRGNDTVDGGGGIDTVLFSGALADYDIVPGGATFTVTDLRTSANEGSDTFTNVEFLQFSDQTIAAPGGGDQEPITTDDTYAVTSGVALDPDAAAGVLSNDDDPEGLPLSAQLVENADNGDLTLNADGSFTYIANPGFVGQDGFVYAASDPGGNSALGTVTINVTAPLNQDPTAEDDFFSTPQGTNLSVVAPGLLDNDSDPDTDPLEVFGLDDPTNGVLDLGLDGSFTYIPDQGFVGTDSFTYTLSDGRGGTDTATVTISVTAPLNNDPVAVDDAFTTTREPLTVSAPGVLDNDSDPDTDPLTAVLGTTTQNGSLTLLADGSFTYTALGNFVGVDSFTYTVSDGRGGVSQAATVTLNVVNIDPTAVDDAYATTEDTPLTVFSTEGVLENDSDAEGDGLSVVVATGPANGTVDLEPNSGAFSYAPNAGFTGIDTFTYTLTDDFGGTDVGTVTITVNAAANNDPTATDDTFAAISGQLLSIGAPGVLDNDSDPDSDPLTASIGTPPQNGTATVGTDGSITYTSTPGFVGQDSFTYLIEDGRGGTDEATVFINVAEPPNQQPVAGDDVFNVITGNTLNVAAPGLLANDSDPDNDPIFAVANAITTQNGTATFQADGTLTYTPNAGFVGADSFDYVLSDGEDTDIGRVTVNVLPVASNVTATDDFATILESGEITAFNVLDNDIFTPGTDVAISNVTVTGPAGAGSVAIVPSGTGVGSVTYDPPVLFTGAVTVDYTLTDVTGTSDTGTLTITVNADPNAPLPQNDAFDVPAGEDGQFDLFADNGNGADTDPNAQNFAITSFSEAGSSVDVDPAGTLTLASGATVTVNASGSIIYDTQDAFDALPFGETATDTIDYVVTNDDNASATASASFTVLGRGPVTGTNADESFIFGATDVDLTVDGLRGRDVIEGGSGDDLLIGGGGGDFIRPGLGTDTIVFGTAGRPLSFGKDVLIGTAEELDGDTITDFRSNDEIGILDANGDLVEARLIVGNGLLQVDVGDDGVIEATLFIEDRINGLGVSWTVDNPFDI
ncbi:MAG: Ig-like domain-containing protein [Pseudomonadota bacterium]